MKVIRFVVIAGLLTVTACKQSPTDASHWRRRSKRAGCYGEWPIHQPRAL